MSISSAVGGLKPSFAAASSNNEKEGGGQNFYEDLYGEEEEQEYGMPEFDPFAPQTDLSDIPYNSPMFAGTRKKMDDKMKFLLEMTATRFYRSYEPVPAEPIGV